MDTGEENIVHSSTCAHYKMRKIPKSIHLKRRIISCTILIANNKNIWSINNKVFLLFQYSHNYARDRFLEPNGVFMIYRQLLMFRERVQEEQ